jgi:hypothetical protein
MQPDEAWQQISEAIPSLHFHRPEQRQQPLGFRRGLAQLVEQLRDPKHSFEPGIRYLEIGTRLGHSLALVALLAGDALELAVSVDAYIAEYGGEPNGLDITELNLAAAGVDASRVELWRGNSHRVLPHLAGDGRTFNLILVDGDHTDDGARRDLEDALELLEDQGVIVFDDCENGSEGNLLDVWRAFIEAHGEVLRISSHVQELEHPGVPAWAWAAKGMVT